MNNIRVNVNLDGTQTCAVIPIPKRKGGYMPSNFLIGSRDKNFPQSVDALSVIMAFTKKQGRAFQYITKNMNTETRIVHLKHKEIEVGLSRNIADSLSYMKKNNIVRKSGPMRYMINPWILTPMPHGRQKICEAWDTLGLEVHT